MSKRSLFLKFFYVSILWMTFFSNASMKGAIKLGVEVFVEDGLVAKHLSGKKIGLITNQTAINKKLETTLDVLSENPSSFRIVAVFSPEHGFYGDAYADEFVENRHIGDIPVFSLHGQTRRPTAEMLKNIDVLVYDIQDIGSRSYTFLSTLCYCMEEAAKHKIKFIVLDRPNPMGGEIVDGPLLEEKWRSFLGYMNIPYCHGMTIGELAKMFNEEYKVGCQLVVVPMEGWKRNMQFQDTGLAWVPTSPQIPEPDTPFFYPTTGIMGHASFVNIGIGYTLPFKVIGAPWIEADVFCDKLNEQHLPGVRFQPFYFRPFYGKFKLENCQGVRILITAPNIFLPVTTQYSIMGILKSLYPQKFEEALKHLQGTNSRIEVFNKLNGNEEILQIMVKEKFFAWKIREKFQADRRTFLLLRQKYLFPQYASLKN